MPAKRERTAGTAASIRRRGRTELEQARGIRRARAGWPEVRDTARARAELEQARGIRRARTEWPEARDTARVRTEWPEARDMARAIRRTRALLAGGRLTDIRETAVRCRRVQAVSIRRIRATRRGRAIPASREGTRRARTHPRTAG